FQLYKDKRTVAYILQQLLTRSATLYPEKPAVWARKRTLTYRELDERSTQLAHLLQRRGLKKSDRVGIFFPKAVEALVCLFVLLKAGGVYVPLDPQAPAERIAYIIENCGIRVLLTNKERRAALATAVENLDYCVMNDDSGSNGAGNKIVPWAMLSENPTS